MKRCLYLYNSMSPFSRKKVYGGKKGHYRQIVGTEYEGGALSEAAMLMRSMKREPGIIPSEVELNKSAGPIFWRINSKLI
jgi:hypothetical protein